MITVVFCSQLRILERRNFVSSKRYFVSWKWNFVLMTRNSVSGPVHTYPEIFVSAIFFMRIHLASTRVRRIRSVYPEISVYALQSGNFCIRCVSGYVWTLVSVYFCIRWRHSIRTSLNAHALLTNPLRCPDTNRIRVDVRIRYVWTQIFLYPHKKICGYKNLRIRVDGA